MDITKLTTEAQNAATMNLDQMTPLEIVTTMNAEDKKVPLAVEQQLPQIAEAVSLITAAFKQGGRLFYIGAGTSGRLGVLDAAECVPTFGIDPEMVQGLIAGGQQAMTTAVEGAEDSLSLAQSDLEARHLNAKDIVVGIAASGRTPYVIGGLQFAQKNGVKTVALSCNANAEISAFGDVAIEVVPGPEILSGSTRLKSGTAQKMVLNMLSTASMVGIGKTYGNLMVDVRPTNEKLVQRAKNIIMQITHVDEATAGQALNAADQSVKLAIVMLMTDDDIAQAAQRLEAASGFVRGAIEK
ncbi:N-acetylmuramic acid 6-phosphate etherase [Lacticaseibacillus brantae]|uniref:N-acetylmuramic acid 6-phosphate etherase n=1 Tax=Lacticaseibacillus brantae DSM 23927 TaxID=1423727 RepID=A0A0R2AXG0_9LACO|nr:N-acetylmuramic acid 6-phosphate etherase [Lacticaseibacillus brantae]KRM71445.1 N-acetylmuramic acid-6-phosphate etherase [Lacticaseibacillus brantae DSM 23927]